MCVPPSRTTPPRRPRTPCPCRRRSRSSRIRRLRVRSTRTARSCRGSSRRPSRGTISCAGTSSRADSTPLRSRNRRTSRSPARHSRIRVRSSSTRLTDRAQLSYVRRRDAPTCAGSGAGRRRTRPASSRARCRFPDGSRRSSRPTSRRRTRSRCQSSTGSRTRSCRPRRTLASRCRDGANGR